MLRTQFLALLPLAWLATLGMTVPAQAWEANLEDNPALPAELVVVNKSARKLHLLEKRSPVQVRNTFPSIHGSIEGDKQVEGDLKTPEGVYFVTGPILAPLDFIEYGSQAYALNYPNPVDKLKGKTGSGIWIHSKGAPIANQVTKGCIAIDLDDIDVLGPQLVAGTPVLVAENVVSNIAPIGAEKNTQPGSDTLAAAQATAEASTAISAETSAPEVPQPTESPAVLNTEAAPASDLTVMVIESAATLELGNQESTPAPTFSEASPQQSALTAPQEIASNTKNLPLSNDLVSLITQKTADWNKAWASRSAAMFDFYDPKAYSVAQGESFDIFRNQKESLFARFAWIQILVGEIHVLQGPDYWVSWFKQYYRAPNLSTEGIRRLYWQPVQGGEIKIVGMEWIPSDQGMERDYLNTLAPSVIDFIEAWRKDWEKGDLPAYKNYYRADAVQDGRKGQAIFDHKTSTWKTSKPLSVNLFGTRVRLEDRGVRVDMTQAYKATNGYQDKGIKELLLFPEGDSWRIAEETWRPM